MTDKRYAELLAGSQPRDDRELKAIVSILQFRLAKNLAIEKEAR